MDFRFTAFEDFGDWKLATTLCDSVNQGPCSDYAMSQKKGRSEYISVEHTVFTTGSSSVKFNFM